MAEKATLIFVPGAWHSSACYEKVIAGLQEYGYKSRTLELATVNPANPVSDDADTDARVIATAVEQVLAEGNNVVLVAHSYGAIPALSAAYDLKDHRSPGITGIALIAAFLPPPKTSLVGLLSEKSTTGGGFHKFDSTGHLIEVGGTGPEDLFYHDLPEHEARRWTAQLRPHSWICNVNPPSAEGVGWHHIPTSYLVCSEDRAVRPSLQQAMIEDANEALATLGSSHRIRVEALQSGHMPFLSMPAATVDFIRRSVGEMM